MDVREKVVRLLVVDDHECIRESLRIIFENTDIKVIAEASNGRAALFVVQEHELDVALVDHSMPDSDGFEVLGQMACSAPQVAVVIYSSDNREHHVRRARQLGAKGWLVKGINANRLREAIRLASAGQTLWDRVPNRNECTSFTIL
jgi:DNA-binding NarL/FixJ family response regulator